MMRLGFVTPSASTLGKGWLIVANPSEIDAFDWREKAVA
jgi:hypothetical protein